MVREKQVKLNDMQLLSLIESIEGMTDEGVRTLGSMLDMGSPALPDHKFRKSLKDNIHMEIWARAKYRKVFGDPRWGR
jgi:hypothetical protein